MISNSTVFIIGAGASADYGFPLGTELVKKIVDRMSKPNTPLLRALHLAGNDPEDTSRFRERLRDSDPDSIDTFLEGNEDRFVRIGKSAIAFVILESESRCRHDGRLIRNPPEENWLRYLWNKLRAGCSPDTLAGNAVTFLTFNYDRVLETYLDTVIENAFNLPSNAAMELRAESFPIIHLHGQISEAEFGYFEEPTICGALEQYASGVRVVHDEFATDDPVFEAAHDAISRASLVCFLGFGYHSVNLTRLRIAELQPNVGVAGSTYDMEDAEIGVAEGRLNLPLQKYNKMYKCERFLRAVVPLV